MKRFHVLVTFIFGFGVVNGIQPPFSPPSAPSPSPPSTLSSPDTPTPPANPSDNPSSDIPSPPPSPSPSPPSAPPPPSAPSAPSAPSSPSSPSSPSTPVTPLAPSAPSQPSQPSPSDSPNPLNKLQPNRVPSPPSKSDSFDSVPVNSPPKSGPTNGPRKRPENNHLPPNRSDDESNADDSSDSAEEQQSQSGDNESTESEQNGHRQREHKDHHEHHEHHDYQSNVQNVKLILLVSYFRSGSSFVGDLLQQPAQTFYTFEPLKYLDFNHKVDTDYEESALRIIRNNLECSLDEEEDYSDWMCEGDKNRAGSSISRNHFLWEETCESNSTICCDVDLIDRVCSQTRTRILKETRLSLESVEKLLQSFPDSLNLKVIFLVRDPRGIYNARHHYRWCKEETCIEYEQLCRDLTSDLQVYPRLVKTYGDRVMIARFEDIALDPFTKGETLYRSLELPYTSSITEYIDTHTNQEIEPDDHFAVLHNSRELITKWVEKLNETTVDAIQNSCESVFNQLGYKPVDLSELANADEDTLIGLYSGSYSLPNRV